jgi:hypothetical protein
MKSGNLKFLEPFGDCFTFTFTLMITKYRIILIYLRFDVMFLLLTIIWARITQEDV